MYMQRRIVYGSRLIALYIGVRRGKSFFHVEIIYRPARFFLSSRAMMKLTVYNVILYACVSESVDG